MAPAVADTLPEPTAAELVIRHAVLADAEATAVVALAPGRFNRVGAGSACPLASAPRAEGDRAPLPPPAGHDVAADAAAGSRSCTAAPQHLHMPDRPDPSMIERWSQRFQALTTRALTGRW